MTIGFLVYDGLQALDLTGPQDVFGAANGHTQGQAPYSLLTIAPTNNTIRTETGLVITPDCDIASAPALDTLVIPGGSGSRREAGNTELLHWVRERAETTRRMVSVCTGLYILGATGLLDGRRATTHWQFADDVCAKYPAILLDTEHLHVADGKFHSSGGLTAGMDLALSLVEDDLGGDMALAVARHLVMYMKRPGNQLQFSAPLRAQSEARGHFSGLVDWLLAHLDETVSVQHMASQVNMSTRNFSRVFREEFGVSPARHLEQLRLERACIFLTSGNTAIDRVARRVGFASADAFRRAFRHRYGTSPGEYRQRFGQQAQQR